MTSALPIITLRSVTVVGPPPKTRGANAHDHSQRDADAWRMPGSASASVAIHTSSLVDPAKVHRASSLASVGKLHPLLRYHCLA